MSSRIYLMMFALMLLGLVPGCQIFRATPFDPATQIEIANPLPIPAMDRWLLMEQVSDELDNYFKIYKEERIRLVDNVMTEGWIETHPKIGATLLEPWHEDSTPGYERLHSSLQTIRRFAKVRVIPNGDSYQLDIKVYKELEDLPEPQHSTVTGKVLRHDSSLDIDLPEAIAAPRYDAKNKGWIPMGRDFSLEQTILRNLQNRLSQINEDFCPPGG